MNLHPESANEVIDKMGGADGIGVQDDLQTRCKPSIQPSAKNSVQNPKFHRGKCATPNQMLERCWL